MTAVRIHSLDILDISAGKGKGSDVNISDFRRNFAISMMARTSGSKSDFFFFLPPFVSSTGACVIE